MLYSTSTTGLLQRHVLAKFKAAGAEREANAMTLGQLGIKDKPWNRRALAQLMALGAVKKAGEECYYVTEKFAASFAWANIPGGR